MAESNVSTMVLDLMDNGTTDWPNTTTTEIPSNGTIPHVIDHYHFCQWILYRDVSQTRIRLWDLLIALPNLCFFIFLTIKFKSTRIRLRASTSPVMFTFYVLVCLNVTVSLIRCVLAMTVNATTSTGSSLDILFWILVRFFLLSTEISIVVFCLAFGHLDSHTSIKRVLIVTSLVSFAYSSIQGTLELIAPDENFYMPESNYQLFGHGGMVFWSCTCAIISFVYLVVTILPWTSCRNRIILPGKPSFYVYTFILFLLNLVQTIGSILYHNHQIVGICIVDITTYLYYTLFTPLVYWTFLASFFSYTKSLMFSYKPQIDDGLDDNAINSGMGPSSNPQISHQLSCSSIRTDGSDFIYQQKLTDPTSSEVRIGDVKLSFYESSLSPDSIQSINS
ncbi:transmembrane protein adipocyte-associated 1 homolog [Tetranychus urticae]|uniref:Transmembrane protein adipocyte-associated 1 homolog n=1 Tax=Tetranychus urticae TaxID=32264 RepID=T1KUC4_TETUR|nr:transmembrane protein adipocyte-associated 1 homolog [Tetranychus urticae]